MPRTETIMNALFIGFLVSILTAIGVSLTVGGLDMTPVYIPVSYFLVSQPIGLITLRMAKKKEEQEKLLLEQRHELRRMRIDAFEEWDEDFCTGAPVVQLPRKPNERLMVIHRIHRTEMNARPIQVRYSDGYIVRKRQTNLMVLQTKDMNNRMLSEWLKVSTEQSS